MALKLPNIAKVTAAANKTTPGSKVGGAVKTAGKGFKGWTGATTPPAQKQFDPYAGLYLKTSDPSTFQSTADSGYAADVSHAGDLANMGMPTNQSLTDAAAARAKGLGDISAALQQHIAQIQQAEVAQGNTGAGQLAAHGAVAGAVPGAGAPTPDAAVPAATATLAGQTAGTGNLLGTIQAAGAQSGAYQQGQAINQGAHDVQQNDLLRQKATASFLAGIASPSARVAGLVSDNEKVAAANAATKLSVWNTLQGQIEQDKLSGDKVQMAKDQLAERKWEAGQSNETKTAIAGQAVQGANDRTAATVAGAGARTQAQIDAANKRNNATIAANKAIAKLKAGATVTAAEARALSTSGKGPKSVTVAVDLPADIRSISGGQPTITPARPGVLKRFSVEQWTKFLQKPVGTRNLAILGLPNGSSADKRAKINYGSIVFK